MREGYMFLLDQSQQHIRQVAAWVDLLGAYGCCHIGNPPGMHVEHGRNGHVDIATMEALVLRGAGQCPKHGQGVQHELPMAKIDTFRVAGGTGGIESCSTSVFIKVGEIEVLGPSGQQVFVCSSKSNA